MKKPQIKIRSARESDQPYLLKLTKDALNYHHRIDPYYKPASEYRALDEYIKKSLQNKNIRIIVAEYQERIVGYFVGLIQPAPKHIAADRIGEIYDAFIVKKYRKHGLGTKMFNALLKWFKLHKIKHIEATADARNEISLMASKKFGFFDYRIKRRLDI